jgi:tripartite-type tricarboxylate transporter receptor subunit TctC
MLAPARVPEPIVARMYDAVAKILKDPEAVKRFAEDGLVATASTPTEFAAFVTSEIAEWSKLVREMQLPIVTLGK